MRAVETVTLAALCLLCIAVLAIVTGPLVLVARLLPGGPDGFRRPI